MQLVGPSSLQTADNVLTANLQNEIDSGTSPRNPSQASNISSLPCGTTSSCTISATEMRLQEAAWSSSSMAFLTAR